MSEGKSGFHMGHFLPAWSSRRSGAGIPTMTVVEPTLDYRTGNFSNDEFKPEASAHVSWEHRTPEAELENITPTLEYNPDGGGGMQVTALYHYGGFVKEDGVKKGQHNIRLVFTYDTNMTESSSIEFGGEFGGEAGKISAKASSSTTVGKAARTWKRDIAFESLPG
ncbi:MAG: hypothetical protein R3320_08780 [Nitriliruptorales bacterium]|nr:hypothetical protein [Nitriliruptorales bacterium]